MRKKTSFWIGLGLMMMLAGCATTETTKVGQSDVDALNVRLSTLQAQLAEKDAEMAKLQDEIEAMTSVANILAVLADKT